MNKDSHLKTEEIDLLNKHFPDGVVAFDLETTGLSPLVDRIIEVSGIKIKKGKVEIFSALVNPQIQIPEKTIIFHGITDEMVKDSPNIASVLPEFLYFIENMPVIAHNAKFDVGFLVYNAHQLKLKFPQSEVFDSCRLARSAFPKSPNHKLITLTENLNIPLINHHRALDDAIACLKVFIKGLEALPTLKKKVPMRSSYLFRIDDFKEKEKHSIPKHLESLISYTSDQTPVEIKYSGGSHKNIFRPIVPVGLMPLPAGDVLYAKCLLSDIYKSFSLRKIKEVRLKPADKPEAPK